MRCSGRGRRRSDYWMVSDIVDVERESSADGHVRGTFEAAENLRITLLLVELNPEGVDVGGADLLGEWSVRQVQLHGPTRDEDPCRGHLLEQNLVCAARDGSEMGNHEIAHEAVAGLNVGFDLMN